MHLYRLDDGARNHELPDSLEKSVDDIPSTIFDDARNHWKNRFKEIKKMNGRENPYQLHQIWEKSCWLTYSSSRQPITRKAFRIEDIEGRFQDVKCIDTTDWLILPLAL
ncbi:MAG: hypothetical protein CM1200mP16_02040 [Nitrospina sp.]|nr:MAG: hypothetical protein CM1200mP16_02040 [Nitrospina sp.]